MKRPVMVLAAIPLLAGFATAMGMGGGGIPSGYVGTWKGIGNQSDPPGEWTIAVAIAGGERGSVVGMIAYPSLMCGGDLVLRATHPDRLELREDITYGECVDQGTVTLTSISDGRLRYDWRMAGNPMTARGTLARAAPVR